MAITSYNDIISNNFNLAPSQLSTLGVKNKNFTSIREILSRELKSSDKGKEVGSVNYISVSTKFFIRAKALKKESFLPFLSNETVKAIRPQVFFDLSLKKGDILISKDSNIGESVILDEDLPNHTVSGAIYKLPIKTYKHYLFAFLKHKYFANQLDLLVPKGSTIRHAKTLFLDCKIPLPNQSNKNDVITYVELLTKAIVNKEKEIKDKDKLIFSSVEDELYSNQRQGEFKYKNPSYIEIINGNRIDAGFYCKNFKKYNFLISNYNNGCLPLDKLGLEFKPGSSLEVRLLGTRLNSDIEKKGFYRLVTPTQISIFGTVTKYRYIGTSYKIPTLQKGDIVFGESGTGRTFVYLDDDINTITNAHGHVLRPIDCDIQKTITIRCILSYLKNVGVIDYMTVGGSGGHLSPSYFNRVLIPEFPELKQKQIASIYHNPVEYNKNLNLQNFLMKDQEWNKKAGIIELDHSIKHFKDKLNNILDKIVNNEIVNIKLV